MKATKTEAVPGGAPSDDRVPVPLDAAELADAKAIADDRERGKIHRLLLVESLWRLRAGRTLERVHGVIHPEMTAITRDALRLAELVFPGTSGASKRGEVEDEAAAGGRGKSQGSELLCQAVEAHTAARVAKVCRMHAAKLRRFMSGAAVPDAKERDAFAARLRIPADAWDAAAA